MTEKRFELGKSENQDTIFDNEGPDDYYHLGNDTRDVKALCKLLNELHEENEQLKKEIKEYKEFIDEVWRKYETAHGLSIENSNWWNND